MSEKTVYQVVDRHTGAVVATCTTRQGARKSADKRDNTYGAYRYMVREVRPSGEHHV